VGQPEADGDQNHKQHSNRADWANRSCSHCAPITGSCGKSLPYRARSGAVARSDEPCRRRRARRSADLARVLGQDEAVIQDGGRLAEAASVAFRPVTEMGYRIASSGPGGRGESVDIIGDFVKISVSADWLEGEIDVELQALGHAAVPLDSVVDLGQVHGLHLRRISRSVTRDQLVSTLTKVVDALLAQAPEVLAQTPGGLARLGA
jgi:hypothetical protein